MHSKYTERKIKGAIEGAILKVYSTIWITFAVTEVKLNHRSGCYYSTLKKQMLDEPFSNVSILSFLASSDIRSEWNVQKRSI